MIEEIKECKLYKNQNPKMIILFGNKIYGPFVKYIKKIIAKIIKVKQSSYMWIYKKKYLDDYSK